MAAGPAPLGFLYFTAAKFAGYTAFCRWIIRPEAERPEQADDVIPSDWWAGAARTLIGVAVGATVILGYWQISSINKHESLGTALFWPLLACVRVGEWWILLRWIYGEATFSRKKTALLIGEGIGVSFVLGFLGIVAAWVLPGGFWVC